MRHLPGKDGHEALCHDASAVRIVAIGERFDCEACRDIVAGSFKKTVNLHEIAAKYRITIAFVQHSDEPHSDEQARDSRSRYLQLSKCHGEGGHGEDAFGAISFPFFSDDEAQRCENGVVLATPMMIHAMARAARRLRSVLEYNLNEAIAEVHRTQGTKENARAASVFAEAAADVLDLNGFLCELLRIEPERP